MKELRNNHKIYSPTISQQIIPNQIFPPKSIPPRMNNTLSPTSKHYTPKLKTSKLILIKFLLKLGITNSYWKKSEITWSSKIWTAFKNKNNPLWRSLVWAKYGEESILSNATIFCSPIWVNLSLFCSMKANHTAQNVKL